MNKNNQQYFKTKRISIRITPEMNRKLERLTKEYGIRSKATAVRLALSFYFGITIDKEDDK